MYSTKLLDSDWWRRVQFLQTLYSSESQLSCYGDNIHLDGFTNSELVLN